MVRQIFILIFCSTIGSNLIAQSISPSILANDGGSIQLEQMQIDWTLGETIISTVSQKNGIITQGFHQPELSVLRYGGMEGSNIQVFPNPVESILNVKIVSTPASLIHLRLTDIAGKVLLTESISPTLVDFELNLFDLPSSTYMLQFRDQKGRTIQTFKISKIKN